MIAWMDHVALVFCLMATLWVLLDGRPIKTRAAILLALAAALVLPIGPYTGLEIAVGAAGTMSVTSIALAGLLLYDHTRGLPYPPNRSEVLVGTWGLIAAGAAIYASAPAFWLLNPYEWGFDPRVLAALAIVIVVASAIMRWIYIPAITAAVVLCHELNLFRSANWWDYTLDVVLWFALITSRIMAWRDSRKR